MPRVGWSVEQRAGVRRFMLFAALFAVAGVILSVFLIISGNTGGWILLGLVACMYCAGFVYIRGIKEKQP